MRRHLENLPTAPAADHQRAVVRRLRDDVAGPVHLPGDAAYDAHRQVVSPDVDAQPAVVVEAHGPGDVVAGLAAAREHDLPFAVQSTGHGTYVPSDGGILLKTTAMDEVSIDPDRQVARVGPGALWGDVLAAARTFGLAPLSGSSATVGVTGFTLGGGVGWLSRTYGFAADSVLRAEDVTADARTVVAGPDEHADLFWALRGGGGNFGVVTSLEFRLYPVRHVYGGIAYFPIERAADVLAAYRDWAATIPDELSTAYVLTRIPDTIGDDDLRGRRAVGLKVLYSGTPADAERWLAPMRAAAGPALVDGFRPMEYADAAMGGTPAHFLDFFSGLSDPVVGELVAAGAQSGPDAPTVEIRHWGGAMATPSADAGPVGHRDAPFSVIVANPPAGLPAALSPWGLGATFLNFLSDPGRIADAYTSDAYQRLRAVKRAYDADNVFRLNHNITPA